MDVFGWFARYEVVVEWVGLPTRRYRFTDRRHVRWALGFGQAADLVTAGVRTTARDRWTGKAITL